MASCTTDVECDGGRGGGGEVVWSTTAERAARKDEPPQGVSGGGGRTSKVRVVPEGVKSGRRGEDDRGREREKGRPAVTGGRLL